jgi:hypothetical protein
VSTASGPRAYDSTDVASARIGKKDRKPKNVTDAACRSPASAV